MHSLTPLPPKALLRLHFDLKQHNHREDVEVPCVHFIETAPSLLQEMPWILHRDYKVRTFTCTVAVTVEGGTQVAPLAGLNKLAV